MDASLYFLCPTDHLESVIEKHFVGNHYFYTSLGNLTALDNNSLLQIALFIKAKEINEIIFILSDDNRILKDAFTQQQWLQIKGLGKTYKNVLAQKKYLVKSFYSNNQEKLLYSYHLNQKIEELKRGLAVYFKNKITISGKLFSKEQQTFYPIYSELICGGFKNLN